MALQLVLALYKTYQKQPIEQALPIIAGPFIIVLTVPIILSLIFSKLNPEIQVVSPLNIQLISFAWIIGSFSVQNVLTYSDIIGLSYLTVIAGLIQDGIAVNLIGKAASKTDILTMSLIVNTKTRDLQSLLLTDKFRKGLGISKKAEETGDCGIILRGVSGRARHQCHIIISLVEGEKNNEVFMDIAVFQEGRYALKRTEDLKEYAIEQLGYLKGIFRRNKVTFEKAPKSHAETLRYFIMDEMQGRFINLQRMTFGSWIKVVVITASILVSLVAYFAKWIGMDTTLVIVITTVLYAIFELPIKQRRS